MPPPEPRGRGMRRRDVIAGLVGAAAEWPVVGRAQQGERARRVGMLVAISENDPQAPLRLAAIKDGLNELGWRNNLQLDARFTDGGADKLRRLAVELLALRPDVIFAGNTSSLAPLHRETSSVPLIFAQVEDPVANGFVTSLAKPGGNITGFSNYEDTMPGKWLQLLKELAPHVTRVGFVFDPSNPSGARAISYLNTVAPTLGVEVLAVVANQLSNSEGAIDSLAVRGNAGLIVLGGSATASNRDRIVALSARYKLPAIYPYRYFVASGGLMSYGADTLDLYRRATTYIDRVLKGERPADLPVQQPTKFEYVINLKTARDMSLDMPASLLARADEVIE
jgi:putative ABC transport system substrate-binding protein